MSCIKPLNLLEKKKKSQKIVMLTAYDCSFASAIDHVSVDVILVGDSLGNVFSGYETTIPVTMDQMVYHSQCVSRVVNSAMVLVDMPFLSYQVSIEEAKKNAGRLVKEGGAHAVKLEINRDSLPMAKAIVGMGIPVMGHLGFTPQSVHQLGYRVQGREDRDADEILRLAQGLEEVGCFGVVLEMVPSQVAATITTSIGIPTIGIGAGAACDGQVLVTHDLLGMSGPKTPRFVRHYSALSDTIKDAITQFKQDVESESFPSELESFD